MLGIAAAIAVLLDQAWFPVVAEERRGAAELTGLVALALGFAHFVHGPGTTWLMAREFWQSATHAASRTSRLIARRPDVESSEVVIVRGSAYDIGTPAQAPDVVAAFAAKYTDPDDVQWLPDVDPSVDLVARISPSVAVLWSSDDYFGTKRRWQAG